MDTISTPQRVFYGGQLQTTKLKDIYILTYKIDYFTSQFI